MNKVYLAGPITGLSYEECTVWRDKVTLDLYHHEVVCLSPMRGKRYLDKEVNIPDVPRVDLPKAGKGMATQSAIVARDRDDTINADMVFVNVLGAKQVSPGTMVEMGWADAMRVPVLLCMEEEGNPHDRAMVRGVTSFRAYTVEEGVQMVKAFFDY